MVNFAKPSPHACSVSVATVLVIAKPVASRPVAMRSVVMRRRRRWRRHHPKPAVIAICQNRIEHAPLRSVE